MEIKKYLNSSSDDHFPSFTSFVQEYAMNIFLHMHTYLYYFFLIY